MNKPSSKFKQETLGELKFEPRNEFRIKFSTFFILSKWYIADNNSSYVIIVMVNFKFYWTISMNYKVD